jgi:hypothetical protein
VTGIVTKPVRTLLGGRDCLICGRPIRHSRTKPRKFCSNPNCRQTYSRLRRRQGETCFHPDYGTGTYQVTDDFWFIPASDPCRRRRFHPSDITFVKNRQARPGRRVDKAFQAEHDGAHDPSWPVQLYRNEKWEEGGGDGEFVAAEERNAALGTMGKTMNGFVKTYGVRTRGGRHRNRKDYSDAIEVYLARQFFEKDKQHGKEN